MQDHIFIDARAAMTQASRTGGLGFAGPNLLRELGSDAGDHSLRDPDCPCIFRRIRRRRTALQSWHCHVSAGRLLLGNSNTADAGVDNLNDATSNEVTAILATGRLFTYFGSRLTLDATKIDFAVGCQIDAIAGV